MAYAKELENQINELSKVFENIKKIRKEIADNLDIGLINSKTGWQITYNALFQLDNYLDAINPNKGMAAYLGG